MERRSNEFDVLHDTGSVPLFIRIITLPFLMGTLWGLILMIGQALGITMPGGPARGNLPLPLAFMIGVLLALTFIGIWFWRVWWLLDAEQGEVIHRRRGMLGVSERRVRLQDIMEVRSRQGKAVHGGWFWEITAIDQRGRWSLWTRVPRPEQAHELAARLTTLVQDGRARLVPTADKS